MTWVVDLESGMKSLERDTNRFVALARCPARGLFGLLEGF